MRPRKDNEFTCLEYKLPIILSATLMSNGFFYPFTKFFSPKTPYLAICKNFCALIGLSIWIEVNGGDTIAT
jgi:hypothetical protein